MNHRMWLAAMGGLAAGFIAFRALQSLGRGVQREMAVPLFPEGHPDLGPGGAQEEEPPSAEGKGRGDGNTEIAKRVLATVRSKPGVRQTDLYILFPQESRRNLQELLLRMGREAVLTRQREGNTYRLYVAGAGS